MKNTLIITLLSGVFAMNVNANEQDDGFWFPNETFSELTSQEMSSEQIALNDATSESLSQGKTNIIVADNSPNNATRHKFVDRRTKLNGAFRNKAKNKSSDKWIATRHVEEKRLKSAKRLNRQFRGRRSHINYQFD